MSDQFSQKAGLERVVSDLGLPPEATGVDVSCGERRHTVKLAERFGFEVRGIDPVQRRVSMATGMPSSRR